MTPAELGPWRERQVVAYAEDNLERSGGDLALARERAERDFTRLLPAGLDTPDTSLVLLVEGGGAGRAPLGRGTTASPGSPTSTTSRSPRRTGVAGSVGRPWSSPRCSPDGRGTTGSPCTSSAATTWPAGSTGPRASPCTSTEHDLLERISTGT